MPRSRGGDPVISEQEAVLSKEDRMYLMGKPTRKEVEEQMQQLVGGLVALRNQIQSFGLRQESLLLAIRRWHNGENTSGTSFDDVLQDAHERMIKWVSVAKMMEESNLPLAQLQEEVAKWNSDDKNAKFRFAGFTPGFLERKFLDDLDMPKDAKVQFLQELATPEPIIAKIMEVLERGLTPTESLPN